MNKKIRKAILVYTKEVKEAARIDITKKVNEKHEYSILDIKESINTLEDDKRIKIIRKAPRDYMFDFFCLTRKGYESLAPCYKKFFYFIKNIILNFLKVKINIDT